MKPHLYFIDPSKVRQYHITLNAGYLRALLGCKRITDAFEVVACLSESTHANLPQDVRGQCRFECIPVVDQDLHAVVRKSLVEFRVMARYLWKMRKGDVAVVSCIIPPALILLELLNRVLRRKGIVVVLHGELEPYIEGRKEHWKRIGFWTTLWMKMRGRNSRIGLAVIDEFIKTALLERNANLRANEIGIVHQPIPEPCTVTTHDEDMPAVCFVGFRTQDKGYDQFVSLSARHPAITFLAIGQGCIEDVRSGQKTPLTSNAAFLDAIARCSAAIFPYQRGYSATLSGAALDAVSVGTHVISTDRPFFASLAAYFGEDFVSVCRDESEFDAVLRDVARLREYGQGQSRRIDRMRSCKYGPASVIGEMETLVFRKAAR